MAIRDEQKLDYLWKKVVFGYTKTDTNENKKAVNESIVSSLILRGDTIWNDSDLIPNVIPDSDTEVVEIYNDSENTSATVECIEDLTASPRRTWLTQIKNWIPAEFGSTYQVKVYIDDQGSQSPQTTGQQIYATGSENNDEWFFDYQPGVLHFIGENLPSGLTEGKAIYIAGAKYVGGVGLQGEQGLFGDLTISGDTISSQKIDGDLVLKPNGAGKVQVVSDLSVDRNLNVDGVINADSLDAGIDGGNF